MECLNCKKEFEAKRPTAKYCSDSCRVMFHRKHGKKDTIKPFQMQALYNEIRDMVGKIQAEPPKETHERLKSEIMYDEPISFRQPQTALKSFEQWRDKKRECETEEEWEQIRAGILAATNLSTKQKDLLIKYS